MPSEKWLKATTTISREKFADIVSEEMNRSLMVAKLANAESIYKLLHEFLPEFSARIAIKIFEGVPEYDEDFDEEER